MDISGGNLYSSCSQSILFNDCQLWLVRSVNYIFSKTFEEGFRLWVNTQGTIIDERFE